MGEKLGYEVTPKQSLDGLWRTMHKYIEHHGCSDISLEMEGSQYEFRQHLQKYDEYEAKAKAWDRVYEAFEKAKNEHEFSNGVCTVMNEYESGELNAKK